ELTQSTGGQAPTRTPSERETSFSAKSDTQGKFRFDDLPAGRYQMTAAKDGFNRQQFPAPEGEPGLHGILTGDPGESLEGIESEVMAESGISGKVVDEEGEPVANARIEAFALSSYFRIATRTGAEWQANKYGQFLIEHLPPGRYILRASKGVWIFGLPD